MNRLYTHDMPCKHTHIHLLVTSVIWDNPCGHLLVMLFKSNSILAPNYRASNLYQIRQPIWYLIIGPLVSQFSWIKQPMWHLTIGPFVIHFSHIKHPMWYLIIRPFVNHINQIIYGTLHLGIGPCHNRHAMWHLNIGWNINYLNHNKHAIWQTHQLGI